MAEKKVNMLADFPAVTTEQWMGKITADLKGADFNKRLVWKTNEGFDVMPFYRAEDIATLQMSNAAPGSFPYVRGIRKQNDWRIRQNVVVNDVEAANKFVLGILNKGVDSVGFKLKAEAITHENIITLLDGIYAEVVELNFSCCMSRVPELLNILTAYYASKGYDASKLKGSVSCDPMARMLKKGRKLTAQDVASFVFAAVKAGEKLPKYKVVGVDALVLNNAGAYCAQELGYALAWGNQYLQLLIESGLSVETSANAIKFNMGVGGNYFMEIAKFRAARWLWATIVAAYKPASDTAARLTIHAETSTYNKTVFDANVNMLRTQTEAMSATLGGVTSLTVNPYDHTFKASDEFSERIARNQQLLLKEESHFDKVADPAAGSYYIETLTAELANQAWALFLEVENSGGFLAAIENGTIQKAMNETAAKRAKAVASRRENLLGTNQFPNFTEKAGGKIQSKTEKCGCDCGSEAGIEPLPATRAAEAFEALRLATEATAKTPKAFMLTIGNLAMRLARAQFSCNFFACAGYEVVDNLGFATIEEGVAAAQAANADIIVLCSSDDEYAELAPAAFNAIGGKQIFVVAGAPACTEELKAVGIHHFINVKSNVLETLQMFNEKLLVR